MRARGQRQIVRHQHEGGARLAVQGLHQLDHARAGLLVQVPGRLVREQDARPIREGARERHPLLLPAGELGGIVVEASPEPDPLEQPARALAQLALGAVADQLEGDQDVLESGERGQEVKRLEDEADVPGAKPRALILGKTGEVHPVEPHAARAGFVETGQQAEQRGLAAARGAQDRDERLGRNAEIDVPQDGQGAAPAQIRLPEPLGHDHMRVACLVLVSLLLTAPGCGPADDAGPPEREAREREEGNRPESAAAPSRPAPGGPRVVFVGTSLTAGFGLMAPEEAFSARLQEMADSAGLPARMVNAGVSGETSAGGLRRIGWVLGDTVDVLVLELGANDGLRGLPTEALRENLDAIIDSTRAHWPDARIVLLGMEAPPNLGPRYTQAFRAVFPEVARARGAELVPFLLEGVGGVRELNQDDGIHPTAEGHRMMARTIWSVLEPLLRDAAVTSR